MPFLGCASLTIDFGMTDIIYDPPQPRSELTPDVEEVKGTHVSPKKDLNIIVAGKTGAGKSTLIGSLLPDQLDRVTVKDGPASSDCSILKEHSGKIGDCAVTVYDTRGFCAAEKSSEDAKLLKENLRKEFGVESGKKTDLFILCHLMFERFDEASLASLKFFGDLLQLSDWNVCIVALTKANLYPPEVE